MRTLVAGWMYWIASNHFSVSQESEISNRKRIDISLQTPCAGYPIPIELKLLDKTSWTGPKLCERMRNQLASDYLSDGTERFGVMLLVWRGVEQSTKRWNINQKFIGISELSDALKEYWDTIANRYSKVTEIEVIVIDLTKKMISSHQQD